MDHEELETFASQLSDETEGSDEGDLTLSPPFGKESVRIEKADRSLYEFHRWYKEGRLIIDPEWQRAYIWNCNRASKLIESFLMEIPVPVIYLAKGDEGRYEVIDGVQRLTSIFKFFDGEFALSGVEMLPTLNKVTFSQLPTEYQNRLKDATLRTFELSPQTSKNLLFVIFERLNTGGVPLNEREIRNCVYRGELNNMKWSSEITESMNKACVGWNCCATSPVMPFMIERSVVNQLDLLTAESTGPVLHKHLLF